MSSGNGVMKAGHFQQMADDPVPEIEEEAQDKDGGDEGEGEDESEGTTRDDAKDDSRNKGSAASGSNAGGAEDGEDGDKASAAGDGEAGAGGEGGGEGVKEQNAGMSADEKKKEKEEKAKKEKEEKARKAAEEKEAKANKAAELKAQKEEQKAQAKAEKEEKRRLKEEERKNRPPKELIPKDTVQTYLKFLSFGILAAAIAALTIMILAFLEETKIHNVLSDAMAIHCASNSLLPNCLFLPEIIFAPYAATLAWSVLLLIAALMLCQGSFSGTSTASLTGFIYLSVLFMISQITLACIILVTYDELNKFVTKSLSCDNEPAPQPPATPCERPLNPQWASDLAHTVEELWDSTHITDSSWMGKIGCNADQHPAYAEGGASCFLSQLQKLSVMASCMLLVPIAVQVPAIWYANQLRWWVGEERGQDLFAYCRLPHSCAVCIMASFMFALIFGVVIAAIPA